MASTMLPCSSATAAARQSYHTTWPALEAVDFDPSPSKDALERTKKTVLLFIKPIYMRICRNTYVLPTMWNTIVPYSVWRHLLHHHYKCGYNGPANLKTKIGGKEVDLSKATSSTKS